VVPEIDGGLYSPGLGGLERRRSFGGRAALHLQDNLQVLPSRSYNWLVTSVDGWKS
jgi:hypothetical protein